MSAEQPSPRTAISDLILWVIARCLGETHGVPDAVLVADDGLTPQGAAVVTEARRALACVCELAPHFGLVVRPSRQMLPRDPKLSRAQRAILDAVFRED